MLACVSVICPENIWNNKSCCIETTLALLYKELFIPTLYSWATVFPLARTIRLGFIPPALLLTLGLKYLIQPGTSPVNTLNCHSLGICET